MSKSKLVEMNEKIAENVVNGYEKIEKSVVQGYEKVEKTFVDGCNHVADAFIDEFFTKEGETVEEAKERMKKAAEK